MPLANICAGLAILLSISTIILCFYIETQRVRKYQRLLESISYHYFSLVDDRTKLARISQVIHQYWEEF